MKTETPRDREGNKLCAWCGGAIRQSGVGRSRDYCGRLCRERAYRKRRDQRLIDEALAAARSVSSTRETGRDVTDVSPVDETGSVQVPAPAPDGDFLLAPPEVPAQPSPQESPVLPNAWKAPAPRRRLSRNRSAMSAEAMPLWPSEEFRPEGADGE